MKNTILIRNYFFEEWNGFKVIKFFAELTQQNEILHWWQHSIIAKKKMHLKHRIFLLGKLQ